jgi:hypothetical protein
VVQGDGTPEPQVGSAGAPGTMGRNDDKAPEYEMEALKGGIEFKRKLRSSIRE